MKAVADKLKALLEADQTINYPVNIKKVEHVGPKTLGAINRNSVPYIGISWAGTVERWNAQRREQIHSFEIHVVTNLEVKETAIVGDGNNDGYYKTVENVASALRNATLSNYLSKPAEVVRLASTRADLGDNYYLFVATLTVECSEIIT